MRPPMPRFVTTVMTAASSPGDAELRGFVEAVAAAEWRAAFDYCLSKC
jgi:hypothetical protein